MRDDTEVREEVFDNELHETGRTICDLTIIINQADYIQNTVAQLRQERDTGAETLPEATANRLSEQSIVHTVLLQNSEQ